MVHAATIMNLVEQIDATPNKPRLPWLHTKHIGGGRRRKIYCRACVSRRRWPSTDVLAAAAAANLPCILLNMRVFTQSNMPLTTRVYYLGMY